MPKAEAVRLGGLRVLVTRPAHQAAGLCRLIEQAGGHAIRFPVLAIRPPQDPDAARRVVDSLDEFDLAVFVSANAVEFAFDLIDRRRGGLPEGIITAAVGKATARALEGRAGRPPAVRPRHRYDSEGLLETPAFKHVDGKRVVIFRGDGGREALARVLDSRGATVTYAEVYRRESTAAPPDPWLIGPEPPDVVTATSSEVLRRLYDAAGPEARRRLLAMPLAVLGERTAAEARKLGFRHRPAVAPKNDDQGLLEAIAEWTGGGDESLGENR